MLSIQEPHIKTRFSYEEIVSLSSLEWEPLTYVQFNDGDLAIHLKPNVEQAANPVSGELYFRCGEALCKIEHSVDALGWLDMINYIDPDAWLPEPSFDGSN